MVASNLGAALANVTRLGSSAELILRALDNRVALAALELQEARQRLAAIVVWSAVGILALLLAGITVTAVVAAIFWDTPHRVTALVTLGVIEVAAAIASGWYVYSRLHRWVLLEHSRDQIAKDTVCLREIFTQNNR
jgi:uncharacterized membrane protein YqjE